MRSATDTVTAFRVVLLLFLSVPSLLLGFPAGADTASVRALVGAAADPQASQEMQIEGMQRLAALDRAAAPALVELLADPEPRVRAVAAYALGQISRTHGADERTAAALVDLLARDREPVVRMNAALALGDTRDAQALAPLIALLDDEDVTMRKMAVLALPRTGRPEAIQPLVGTFNRETDPEIRTNVIRGLGALHAFDELVELRRSVSGDSPLWWEIEALLQERQLHPETEERHAWPVAAGGAGTRARYFFFITQQPTLMPAAVVLLGMPVVLLVVWSFARMPLRGWPVRLGIMAAAVALSMFFGGMASLPGFARGLHVYDPRGTPAMWIPFLGAVATVPVVLCACVIGVRRANGLTDALLNAAFWAGVYALLQCGTWLLVPVILERHYFHYGLHPDWHVTQLGYVIGVGLTCAVVSALLRAAGHRTGWCGPLDRLAFGPYAAVTLPGCAALGLGYLLVNIYAY
jgi:hypothetical protein